MEDNKLAGQTQENSAFNRKSLLAVDFEGRARIKGEKEQKSNLVSEFIPGLNRQAEEIAEEIHKEIINNLPHGFDVSLDIYFAPGSVNWTGVAAVLDVAGKIVDGVDFTKLAISVIRFAINKIIRRKIEAQYQITKLDTHVTKQKIKDTEYPATRFFWWCGGTSKDILRDSTFSEKAKYVSMGGVLLTTGVLACASGGYALYTVFESNSYAPLIGLAFGLVWGLIIFNLDRYIVTSMKKVRDPSGGRTLRQELRPAWPRFFVALLLGITISVPLELRLFKPEIDSRIKFRETEQMRRKGDEIDKRNATTLADLNLRLERNREEITKKEQQVNSLREAFYQEMDRRGGTRVYGYGSVARRKEAEFLKVANERKSEIELISKENDDLRGKINQIEQDKNVELGQYRETLGKGILERIIALAELSKEHLTVLLANLLVSLLLIFFEMAPVIVKLLSAYGPYDAKLDLREEAEVERAKNKKVAVVSIEKKHFENLTKAEIAVEEMVFNESIVTREQEIRSDYQRWASERSNGQRVSFKEFLKSIRDSFYLERD